MLRKCHICNTPTDLEISDVTNYYGNQTLIDTCGSESCNNKIIEILRNEGLLRTKDFGEMSIVENPIAPGQI